MNTVTQQPDPTVCCSFVAPPSSTAAAAAAAASCSSEARRENAATSRRKTSLKLLPAGWLVQVALAEPNRRLPYLLALPLLSQTPAPTTTLEHIGH